MSLKADLVKNDTIDETAPKSEGSLNEPTYDFKEVAKTITEIIQLLDDCEAKYSGTKSLTGVIKDQAKVIGARLLEITQTPSRKRQERFREDSVKLEEALGITDTYSRTNEALLFIDPPFLKTLSLAGVPHPEEGFGIAAWQNWLKARAEARNTENLDLATVMHLHEVVAAGLGETVAGKIRQEGALGGDYTETGTALHLKSQQLQALAGNPLLKINTLGEESAGVLIIYPNAKYQESYSACLKTLPEDVQQAEKAVLTTESLIKALLKETLSWYENEEAKLKADLDPSQREKDLQVIKIAAELQQRIVSIHPFRDGNGRLSRLLMNYVLEKHGVAPSIIELGDQDIFYTPEEWAKLVEEGTNKHERRIVFRAVL
ncbi:MAG: Fic family protein [candidate division WWE3 bacterium]|nr:Fic family protein [candidate division WWE3 bacterium]